MKRLALLIVPALMCAVLVAPARGQAMASDNDSSLPSDSEYPGVIALAVDATDVARRIYQVRETIPVQTGRLKLWYPQWIPGNHSVTGPINQFAGLVIQGNGHPLQWRRDPLDIYAFEVDVPAGVSSLEIEFQSLSPTASDQGRVAMTTELMSVQWSRLLLYPAGHDARRIRFQPSLRLPPSWQYGSALQGMTGADGVIRFEPLALVALVDSPVYAGRHFKRFDLDPGAKVPVHLDVVADSADLLEAKPEMIEAHRALVRQADLVFGTRPFAHYDFLLALSSSFSSIGLEHHQSSENGTFPDYLRGDAPFYDNDLLPHEYTHAWNGKFRRPEKLWTPHYNTPMQNQLLWVYEGQTQFWAVVLAARSSLWTPEQAREVLAGTAALYDHRAGRNWRNLQDTVYQGIVDFNDAPQPWESWQRGYDFYAEGTLLWLDVDMRLRELSKGRKSLDDFAHSFFGGSQGAASTGVEQTSTYGFNDVVDALARVQADDWAGFLTARLQDHATRLPLDGLDRAGWRLVYNDQPNAAIASAESEQELDDFSFSLGLKIDKAEGKVSEVLWDSPAFRAGVAKDMQVIAINGTAYTGQRLTRAVVASGPLELLVRQTDAYRSVVIDYHDGLRQPHLERVAGKPDLLSAMLAARK